MIKASWKLCAAFLLLLVPIPAIAVRVRVLSDSGARVPGARVTISALNGQAPSLLFRMPTDSDGWAMPVELVPGLYQFHSTDLRGRYQDAVKELYVDASTGEVVLRMRSASAKSDPPSRSSSPPTQPAFRQTVALRFLSEPPAKSPMAGFRVLVRNANASRQKWVNTDITGKIMVDLDNGPTTFAVLPIDGKIYTYGLLNDCAPRLSLGELPSDVQCVSTKSSFAEIVIPVASDQPTPTPNAIARY